MTQKTLWYDNSIAVQERYYWCGPASAQMILNGRGIIKSEQDLANEIGTNVDGTAWVGLIVPVLNRYLPDAGYAPVLTIQDPMSQDQKDTFWRNIVASIDAGYGVSINIVAPPSNYPRGVMGSATPSYGGGTIYHYIAAMGYDDTFPGGAVLIADSGFRPFGYWIAFDQLATLVPPKGYAAAHPQNVDLLEVIMATNQVKFDEIHRETVTQQSGSRSFMATDSNPVDTPLGVEWNTDANAWNVVMTNAYLFDVPYAVKVVEYIAKNGVYPLAIAASNPWLASFGQAYCQGLVKYKVNLNKLFLYAGIKVI